MHRYRWAGGAKGGCWEITVCVRSTRCRGLCNLVERSINCECVCHPFLVKVGKGGGGEMSSAVTSCFAAFDDCASEFKSCPPKGCREGCEEDCFSSIVLITTARGGSYTVPPDGDHACHGIKSGKHNGRACQWRPERHDTLVVRHDITIRTVSSKQTYINRVLFFARE